MCVCSLGIVGQIVWGRDPPGFPYYPGFYQAQNLGRWLKVYWPGKISEDSNPMWPTTSLGEESLGESLVHD